MAASGTSFDKNFSPEVISVPLRLRLSASLLFIGIPLSSLEVALITQAPWWNLPYPLIGYWGLIFALICFPLVSWIWAAKKWAYSLLIVLSAFWVLVSVLIAIRTRNPSLGFFVFFLLIGLVAGLFWIGKELGRSFIDPQISWYQGLPRPVPGVRCRIVFGEKELDLRVSRLDRDGAFLFSDISDSKGLGGFLGRKKLEVWFHFRNHQALCTAIPTVVACEGRGLGVRFFGNSLDAQKKWGDFLEMMRGEGYIY